MCRFAIKLGSGVWALCGLLASCDQVLPSRYEPVACKSSADCPIGFACGAATGTCIYGGDARTDGSSEPADFSMGSSVDFSTGRDASVSPPDLKSACVFLDGVGKVQACKGTFAKGAAQTLCPAGLAVCNAQMPATVLASLCNTSTLGGFFAVDVPHYGASLQPLSSGICSRNIIYKPGLAGCGEETPGSTATAPVCAGWPRGVIYELTSTWTGDGTIAGTANSNPNSGVVCCAP
jgi:hypothetical protein